MPRSRGGSGGRSRPSAPSRPAAAPARPAATPPQQSSRGASTSAHPPANAQQPGASAQQGKSPGLFGQMASTAAGVAVGSSIGHAIGGMFGSGAPAEQQHSDNAVATQANESSSQSNAWGPRSCETDAKTFTKCLDENQGNMQICGWYLDQLKACQQACKTSPAHHFLVSVLPYSPQKDNADQENCNSESVLVKTDLAISAYDGENNKNEQLYYRSSQNNLQTASRWRPRFFEDIPASRV